MFQVGAGGFFRFDDEIRQGGDLSLFVRQQARGIGCAEGCGDQIERRLHNFPITEETDGFSDGLKVGLH